MNKNVKQTIALVKAARTIFDDVQQVRTLGEILNIIAESTVTLETDAPFTIYKNYNEFGWSTFNTNEVKGKFGMVTESEEILVFEEVENDENDEDELASQAKFEINVQNIESFEYCELSSILQLHLDNNMCVRLSCV